MVMAPAFDNLFNKVKTATKQAANSTARQAKIAKLKMNLMTIQTEKSRHLQTVGIRAYDMHNKIQKLDGDSLLDQVRDELGQLARIDTKIADINAEIAQIQASATAVEVEDVTEEDEDSPAAE